ADHLGLDRFAVVGGSGGGPHALACAALLPDRVTAVACQSSLAPVGVGGMPRRAWTDGMGEGFAAELAWAEAGESRVAAEVRRLQDEMEAAVDDDPADLMGEGLSEVDVAFLSRADLRDNWRRIVAEQAVDGIGGAVDDVLAFARPWGFNLARIDVPVLVTHGAQDVSCPPAHGRWLASRIRGAELRISDTGGHLPEHPEAEIAETMAWLRRF
ncbi:alpha/beta fold hydrolase, partial [Nocardioides sp.]|uniref:alpha/beta fold hydrolase n=1 Tax=Nocardioides sp. TaxID=35761 RepID=UPI00271D8309